MSSNKKSKILKGAVAAVGVASVIVPASISSATTISSGKTENVSESVSEKVSENSTTDISNGKSENVSENATSENAKKKNSEGAVSENVKENSNIIAKEGSNKVIKISSNKPEIPYFYYWTNIDNTYLSWDYGHLANRPEKIEAIIDSSPAFSNPNYIEVKPKGAEFIPNIPGDFYLRVRFFDSFGNVTHESIRKVVRNSTETREIKGLAYKASCTGIRLSWAKFVDGIKSVKIYVNNKLERTLSPAEVKEDSYVLYNIPEKAEIKVSIVNGNGVEYNGVVFVNKSKLNSKVLNLGVSEDGAGITVDFSKTGFKAGDKFLVNIIEKTDKEVTEKEVVVKNTEYVLDKDKGSFTIYPDKDRMFLNGSYIVNIKDLRTGDVYKYDYIHRMKSASDFVTIGLTNGQVVASWNNNGSVAGNIIWSTSKDFSDYKSIDIDKGNFGVSFDTKLAGKNTIYLMLTTYDEQGRVISQDFDTVTVGEQQGNLVNFKGVFKGKDTAQFTWDKVNTEIVKGILRVNNKYISLSPLELANLNRTNSIIFGGIKNGSKHDVSLLLIDKNGKIYEGRTASILSSENDSSEVIIEGVSGLYARYNVSAGVLTLVLDEAAYSVQKASSIKILVNGKAIDSVQGKYVGDSNSVNITGFIPTKEYKNITVVYTDKNGSNKSIVIPSLLIKKGGNLDSFLVNAYNQALSRESSTIDEQGYNYWKQALISKKIGLSYFIRNLVHVPEFMKLANSPEELVTRLYKVILLRNPEPQGLQFWKLVYDGLKSKGVSHNQATMKILTDMSTSNEFANLAERLSVNP